MEPKAGEITELNGKTYRQLTERTYLGEGWLHRFKNNETGEVVYIECSEAEYRRLGEIGGSKYNPILEGHTWEYSLGGTIKVDTPNTILGDNDYCIKDGKVHAFLLNTKEKLLVLPLDAVGEDSKLDESKLIVSDKQEVIIKK